MQQQIKLPIALTPEDWRLIDTISSGERIIGYALHIAQMGLPRNKPLDLEHRQYLYQRDWDSIRNFVRKNVGYLVGDHSGGAGDSELLNETSKLDEQVLLQARRIFCYSYHEEGASYTLDDFFHWLDSDPGTGGDHRRFSVPGEVGGSDYVEWNGDSWHYYENNGQSSRWYDNGSALSEYADMILTNWLLAPEDADDVMKTSPGELDEILRKKAEQKPEEVQKALDSKKMQNWETLEFCYAPVSVRFLIQLGLRSEEDIANGLQEEYLFHFGKMPAIIAYDKSPVYACHHFLPGETDGSERQFRRFPSEEHAQDFLKFYKNAKLILPPDSG